MVGASIRRMLRRKHYPRRFNRKYSCLGDIGKRTQHTYDLFQVVLDRPDSGRNYHSICLVGDNILADIPERVLLEKAVLLTSYLFYDKVDNVYRL